MCLTATGEGRLNLGLIVTATAVGDGLRENKYLFPEIVWARVEQGGVCLGADGFVDHRSLLQWMTRAGYGSRTGI